MCWNPHQQLSWSHHTKISMGWNLSFPSHKIISLYSSSQWGCHAEAQCTMQRRDASLIRVVTSALLPSSSPHPTLTCHTILPGLRVWKTQSNEGMDCTMNGSCCVIFTFPGLSPPVFHYNNRRERSDKAGVVAIRHDNSPNLSDLLYLVLLGSREDNGAENAIGRK